MYCYLESLEQLLKGACQEMKLAQFGDLLIWKHAHSQKAEDDLNQGWKIRAETILSLN